MRGSGSLRRTAIAVAAVLVVAGCGGSAATPSATAGERTPAATAAEQPTGSPGPATTQAANPSSSLPPCRERVTTSLDPAPAEPAQLADIRVETGDRGDRITFAFAGDVAPAFEIAPADPPFVQDASGLPVEVPGVSFLRIRFPFATGMATYAGPTAFDGSGAPDGLLVSLVRTGDFEAVMTWVVGTSRPACVRVATLAGQAGVMIDLAPSD